MSLFDDMSFTHHNHSLIHGSHVTHSSKDHMTDHISFTHQFIHHMSFIHSSHVIVWWHVIHSSHSFTHPLITCHSLIQWSHVIDWSHVIHSSIHSSHVRQCPTTVLAVSRRRPGSVPAVSRHHPARRRSLESDLSMYKWSSNGAQMELPRGSNAQMEPNEAQMEPSGAQMELQRGSSLNGAHWSSSGARLSSNGAGGRGMVERGLW